jgi:hypothetical protein
MQASGKEPDWDAEMQMFRERTMRPNQLETLRKAEELDVDIGKVRPATLKARIHLPYLMCHHV